MSDNDENQQQTKQNSPWSARISDSTKKLIQESTRTTGLSVEELLLRSIALMEKQNTEKSSDIPQEIKIIEQQLLGVMPLVRSYHLQMQTQVKHEREENLTLLEDIANTNNILAKKQAEFDKREREMREQSEKELEIRIAAETLAQQETKRAQEARDVFEQMKKIVAELEAKLKAHEPILEEINYVKMENDKLKSELNKKNFELEKAITTVESLKKEANITQKNMTASHENEIQRIRNEVESKYLDKHSLHERESLERERHLNDKINALNEENKTLISKLAEKEKAYLIQIEELKAKKAPN